MPTGKLHTFEFHAERCAEANKEFERHGLSDFVSATHRDVSAEGFGLTNEVDAVFLDLPGPWECVVSAKQALRPGNSSSVS
jgi:tRNA (adenine57-N1/adenine58-N1)-methyltransferase